MKLEALTVVGIMSGTSADGIDVAIVRITPVRGEPELALEAHASFAFPAALREAVLSAMEAGPTTTEALAKLNWRLGLAYAEAVRATIAQHAGAISHVDLIGCHGQTVYHQGVPSRFAGKTFACTWQLGEPALLAQAIGVPVVSNFRPADMAVHGQGAPLVPLLDYTFYRHRTRTRVLQNLGGIGNLSVIPSGAGPEAVFAFDTGPGNMVIDAAVTELFSKPYDKHGRIAASGRVLQPVLDSILRQPFFLKAPPRSAGREQFGASFTKRFTRMCRSHSERPEDIVRTATALTAASIALAYERYVTPAVAKSAAVDFIVSGGGAKNITLMTELRERLAPTGAAVSDSGDFGMPVEAKEAMAFALLAYQSWYRRPGNVPSATGADRPVILGQISYV